MKRELSNQELVSPIAPDLPKAWVIVTQVKSNRLVYFTDDPAYQPAMDGDWYYCNSYLGELPGELTLRNCWGWKFNGGVFSDARGAPAPSQQEVLLESNRRALLAILNEKINKIREPYLPVCVGGEVVRRAKLQQAHLFLGEQDAAEGNVRAEIATKTERKTELTLLQGVAVARRLTLMDAAQLVLSKAEQQEKMMIETERFREQLSQSILLAQSPSELHELREILLTSVYPALSESFKFKISNTEPFDPNAPLSAQQLRHEVARLKARLSTAINAKRARFHSEYLMNDEVLKHKAKLAQLVILHDGEIPRGVDITMLANYAQARSVPLIEAAQLLVSMQSQLANVLAITETFKDHILSRIDSLTSNADVRGIESEVFGFEQSDKKVHERDVNEKH